MKGMANKAAQRGGKSGKAGKSYSCAGAYKPGSKSTKYSKGSYKGGKKA